MASEYLLKSSGDTLIVEPRHSSSGAKLTTVAGSATQTYKVDLPPGTYQVAIAIDSNVTGTTTAIDDVVPFLDAAQTKVPAAATYEFSLLQPSDAATSDKTVAVPAGDGGAWVVVAPNSGTAAPRELPLHRGFQFTVTKGGATTGEKFIVYVIASKISVF